MKTGGEAREASGARGARGAWGLQGEGPRSWKSRKECSETLANSYFETYKSYDHIQIMRIISKQAGGELCQAQGKPNLFWP